MAIKFQYNKTSLQALNAQLKIRQRALPTLKNKEAALRVEVKRAKDHANKLDQEFNQSISDYNNMISLWGEFDTSLVEIKDVHFSIKKIAGVVTPVLDGIDFDIKPFSIFNKPSWFLEGVTIIQRLAEVAIEREFFFRKMEILDYARRKTTQKVNLYEKVQIPGFEDAILKIKRYLEDVENLSKAAQKIVKKRHEDAEMVQPT